LIQGGCSMAGVRVRRAKAGELEAILDLWQEMMEVHARLDGRFRPTPNAREQFRPALKEWLANPNMAVFVADAGESIVGYLIVRVNENPPMLVPQRYGYVSDVCVASDQRRAGVGRKLFSAARAWFRRNSVDVVQLNVAASNPAAQGFWREMGFQDYVHRMWLDL
jgi:ribosomal protein S18 acetylase RimI-like enzyme